MTTETSKSTNTSTKGDWSTEKKFIFWLIVIVGIFLLIWFLWLNLCSGGSDEEDQDEDPDGKAQNCGQKSNTFCKALCTLSTAINAVLSTIDWIFSHFIISLIILGTGIAVYLFLKPGASKEAKDKIMEENIDDIRDKWEPSDVKIFKDQMNDGVTARKRCAGDVDKCQEEDPNACKYTAECCGKPGAKYSCDEDNPDAVRYGNSDKPYYETEVL